MLKDYLEKYRELSVKIINSSEIEEISNLIECREEIIEELKKNNFDKTQYSILISELNIIELDKKVGEKLINEKSIIKSELAKLHKMKMATTSYGNNMNPRNLFSTRI